MSLATMIDAFMATYGVVWAVCGVATLITGKVFGYGRAMNAKYTAESLHAAAPMLGAANLLIGVFMSVPKICGWLSILDYIKTYEWYILAAGAVLGIVFIVLGLKKLVVKEAA